MKTRTLFAGCAALALFSGTAAWAAEEAAKDTKDHYPLKTCVVTGEDLGDQPVVVEQDGLKIRLCCKGCSKKVAADPEPYAKKVKDAYRKAYPLDTCVISGGKLGGMGEPVLLVHEDRPVFFCCKGCIGKFKKDPAPSLAKIDAAAKAKAAAAR